MATMYHRAGPPASGQKVFLATPAYQGVDAGYAFALFESAKALDAAGIESEIAINAGDCHVDDSRNRLVRQCLGTDCTDLVFLDADLRWQAHDLVALCRADREVVAATYPLKQDDDPNGTYPVVLIDDNHTPEEDGLLEVEAVPTGFLRIRRNVLELLARESQQYFGKRDGPEPTPLIFERSLVEDKRWGGDYTFCRKWRMRGGDIWLMPDIDLAHTGTKTWDGSIATAFHREGHTILRFLVGHIAAGNNDPKIFRAARRYVDNPSTATEMALSLSVELARKADGPIIETGSGLSTIVMAAASAHPVYCLEHDRRGVDQLSAMIRQSGVGGVGLLECPLADRWYDLSDFDDLPERFALGFNDGPARALGDRMGFFHELADRCDAIIVDDMDEVGYRAEVESWCRANGRRIDFVDGRVALIRHHQEAEHAA